MADLRASLEGPQIELGGPQRWSIVGRGANWEGLGASWKGLGTSWKQWGRKIKIL